MPKNHESRLLEIKQDNRAFRVAQVRSVDEEARTVELAFSSEAEVSRWWGIEILSHDAGSVVMSRISDGAPLLVNHSTDDQVGVIEAVSIDADRRGRAVVRFGNSARADEIFRDVKDGIRKHVSVGYLIHEAKLTEERGSDDVYTVTSWEPFEISIVPVPADHTVGVGRSMDAVPEDATPPKTQPKIFEKEARKMDPANEKPEVDVNSERLKATELERARVRSIVEMGEKFKAEDLARDAVKDGMSVDQFQRSLLDHINDKQQRPIAQQMRESDVGLTDKEARQYSLMKLVRALAMPAEPKFREDAAFEFEVSRAAEKKSGKNSNHIVVPTDVLTRALNTSTAGTAVGDTGGNLVAADLLANSFIEILRNKSTIMSLGRVMGGMVGNVDIPYQIGKTSGYWIGEGDDATESGLDIGHISLSPKTVAGYTELTRRQMMQSSLDAEALLRADLAEALATTIDLAGYYGTGTTHQPRGIVNYTGINAVTFATAGKPEFSELVDMETAIANQNADVDRMVYVANAAFRGYAKTKEKFATTGQTLWENGGTINGYRAVITNQIAAGDVIMGNFGDLIIAMWGGLELRVDPYAKSKSGGWQIIGFQDVDFALRRKESFCLGRK